MYPKFIFHKDISRDTYTNLKICQKIRIEMTKVTLTNLKLKACQRLKYNPIGISDTYPYKSVTLTHNDLLKGL